MQDYSGGLNEQRQRSNRRFASLRCDTVIVAEVKTSTNVKSAKQYFFQIIFLAYNLPAWLRLRTMRCTTNALALNSHMVHTTAKVHTIEHGDLYANHTNCKLYDANSKDANAFTVMRKTRIARICFHYYNLLAAVFMNE